MGLRGFMGYVGLIGIVGIVRLLGFWGLDKTSKLLCSFWFRCLVGHGKEHEKDCII